MRILAFMQNPWFREGTPDEWILRYRDDQEFHRRILARSMSGSRLVKAFGKESYDRIHWDNVNWRAASVANGILPPDMDHIAGIIYKIDPQLIICFGRVALNGLTAHDPACPVWGCHHPNARGKTQHDLNVFAQMVHDFERAANISIKE